MQKKLFNFICLSLLIFFFSSLFSQVHANIYKPNQFTMHEREYTLSTYYTILSKEQALGNISKTRLSLRTSYEYFLPNGQLGSTAYLRLLSMGSMFTWAGVLDIYDAHSEHIGTIEGGVLTLLPSRFSFYDSKDLLVATAYMDIDCMGFTIVDPKNESRIIAHLDRIFVRNVTDYWSVNIIDTNAIDPRLLYSFCAFAIDNQGDFRQDN